jgi:hypothetical protein
VGFGSTRRSSVLGFGGAFRATIQNRLRSNDIECPVGQGAWPSTGKAQRRDMGCRSSGRKGALMDHSAKIETIWLWSMEFDLKNHEDASKMRYISNIHK